MNLLRATYLLTFLILSNIAARPAHADGTNGGSGLALGDPPLVVDADWFATPTLTPPAFFWNSGVGALNNEGPFTFNAATPVRLDVTDDFFQGDRFEVFDFGASLGLTSSVASALAGEVGPEAAFNSPLWSHGSFFLSAGAHSITIGAAANPYDGGRGYLRALSVPEPHSIAISALALIALISGARIRSVNPQRSEAD
jgi:hypothetical protein